MARLKVCSLTCPAMDWRPGLVEPACTVYDTVGCVSSFFVLHSLFHNYCLAVSLRFFHIKLQT